jgi:Kef-type K+ transport system membrane component KefB
VYDKFDFLADLTVALVAAGLAGAAARRLRLNPVVGYLIAGSVIGPSRRVTSRAAERSKHWPSWD